MVISSSMVYECCESFPSKAPDDPDQGVKKSFFFWLGDNIRDLMCVNMMMIIITIFYYYCFYYCYYYHYHY